MARAVALASTLFQTYLMIHSKDLAGEGRFYPPFVELGHNLVPVAAPLGAATAAAVAVLVLGAVSRPFVTLVDAALIGMVLLILSNAPVDLESYHPLVIIAAGVQVFVALVATYFTVRRVAPPKRQE